MRAWRKTGARVGRRACFYVGEVTPLGECAASDLEACLAEPGCGWGTADAGVGCFFFGEVTPQDVCADSTNPESCLATDGCAWGDVGSGELCFLWVK